MLKTSVWGLGGPLWNDSPPPHRILSSLEWLQRVLWSQPALPPRPFLPHSGHVLEWRGWLSGLTQQCILRAWPPKFLLWSALDTSAEVASLSLAWLRWYQAYLLVHQKLYHWLDLVLVFPKLTGHLVWCFPQRIPFYLFIIKNFFWPCHETYRVLVPWLGIKPSVPAVELWSLNQRTAREVPRSSF